VPGCVHTDLLAHKAIEDPFYGRNEKSLQWIGEKDWEYRKTFYINENVVSAVSNVWLVLEGVDTYATVSVNGLPVVETDNMFRTYRADLKNVLRKGENEISVSFESVFKRDFPKYLDAPYKLQAWPNNDQSDIWLSLYARKAGYNYGWDWGPRLITTGLWKPVYIEIWKDWKIESVQLKTLALEGVSVKSGKAVKARMQADVYIESDIDTPAEIAILCDGKKVHKEKVQIVKGDNQIPCNFTVRNPELWWSNGLGKATLHDFEIEVETDGSKSSFTEKTGIRTSEIIREDDQWGRSLSVRLN
jgi:beta-mannosidase